MCYQIVSKVVTSLFLPVAAVAVAGGRLRRPCKLQHGISLNQTSVEPVSFGVKSVSRLYTVSKRGCEQSPATTPTNAVLAPKFLLLPVKAFNAFAETLGTRKIGPGAIRILAYLHDNLYVMCHFSTVSAFASQDVAKSAFGFRQWYCNTSAQSCRKVTLNFSDFLGLQSKKDILKLPKTINLRRGHEI
jgi:hypothetical protein